MATKNDTNTATQSNGLIVGATFARLRELADAARDYRRRQFADVDEATKRMNFVDWSESAAEARGFLECLTTLNLLSEADEVAWYEYLSGEREAAPDAEDA